TNSFGATNSQAALLTVNPKQPEAPAIVTQPESQTVTEGANVLLSVVASGTAPLVYQWQFNGVDLKGATNSALALPSITTNQAGAYLVNITNALGFTNSQT